MKYALTALLLAVLTVAFFPIAYADTHAEASASVDAETQVEVADMDTVPGAQVRLLQLERQIQRKVIEGNALIAALETRANSSNRTNATNATNLTVLKDIIAELEVMVKQVQDAQKTAAADNQAAVDVFVTVKADAKDLIKEFREAAKAAVTEEDRDAIKEARENADRAALKALNDRIEQAKKDFRADYLADSLERAGIADADLIAKVRAGTITIEEARAAVRAEIKSMTAEERRAALASVQEEVARRRVQLLSHIDKVEEKLDDRQERTEERIAKLEEKGYKQIADRIQKRAEKMQNWEDRLDERKDRIEDRADRMDDRFDRMLNNTNQTNRTFRMEGRGPGRNDAIACPAIAYPTCDATRVGMKCNGDDEATGYECDRVDACSGICRADDDNESDMNDDDEDMP